MNRPDDTPPSCTATGIRTVQVVVPCADLAATLDCLRGVLGFRVELVMPADAPTMAVVSGHGLTLCLRHAPDRPAGVPIRLRVLAERPAALTGTAPAGRQGDIELEIEAASAPVVVPPGEQRFVLTRLAGTDSWSVGRAGMLYRDLIPGRLGGRFIASHIRIPQGGPIPDWVHFHRIRFQMIYCRTGSARLVYEDQGDPFEFTAGDCVLQPPEIRHRVLEASDGFEVVEIGCPAVHETHADPALTLPTGRELPDRRYGGQRFVRHVAATATWQPWPVAEPARGFEARDTGIADATDGLAGAVTVRADATGSARVAHAGEFLFLFVLAGSLRLESVAQERHELAAGDSCVLPAGDEFTLSNARRLELLEVRLPAGR
jgi:quercetin dioxygenase-like cupin family protein